MKICFRTQLNFIVAIDYTGSNGDPRDPKSLHYFDPGKNSKSRDNTLSQSESDLILNDFESKKCIKIISTQMLSELLVTLSKNMILISNFRHTVLAQNYQMAKESFQRFPCRNILYYDRFKVVVQSDFREPSGPRPFN